MRANRLPARAGLRWISGAFAIFRMSPLRQLLLSLAFLLALMLALSVPVAGFALAWALVPALVVGMHEVARVAARGEAPQAALLVAGFRLNAAAQLRLGGVFLAGMAVVIAASVPADGGRFAQAMLGVARLQMEDLHNEEMLNAMRVVVVLQTAVLAALWYTPLLVGWNGMGALKAVFFSTAAMLINWRPFLVYGMAMTILFTFVLMLAIVGAMLFGGSRVAQANSAAFAVLWTLLPVWFASSYLSYREVFDAENAAGGEPPKSPTIAA
jgi:hypothetical protein